MTKSAQIAVFIFCLVAGITIIESSYLGINGHHTFRQADFYGNILGILKIKDFKLFDLFTPRSPMGARGLFDIPIYQYIIAVLSKVLIKDPLVVTRYFNLVLWMATAFFGFRISQQLGSHYCGVIFVGLFSSSPLLLHYFSVPFSDILSVTFSVIGSSLIVRESRFSFHYYLSILLIILAILVKSPIPYVFVVFVTTYFLMRYKSADRTKSMHLWPLFVFLSIILCATVLTEYCRGVLMHKIGSKSGHLWSWYFGPLDLRYSGLFWKTFVNRFNAWIPSFFFYIYLTVSILSICLARRFKNISVIFAAIVALLAGWITFSNIYMVHDYYQLPVVVIVFLSFSVSSSYIIEFMIKKKWLTSRQLKLLPVLFIILFCIQTLTQASYSHKERANFWKSAEYVLKEDDVFLYVSNITHDPTVGGHLSTKFDSVSPIIFAENCKKYLLQYRSILIGDNIRDKRKILECIKPAKIYATHYLIGEGNILIRTQPSIVKNMSDNP